MRMIHDYDARKPRYARGALSAASLFCARTSWARLCILYYILYFRWHLGEYSRAGVYRSSPAVIEGFSRAFSARAMFTVIYPPRRGFVKIARTRFPLFRGTHVYIPHMYSAMQLRRGRKGVKRSGGASEIEWNAKRR